MNINNIIDYLVKQAHDYNIVGEYNGNIEGFSSLNNYKKKTITWIKKKENYDGKAIDICVSNEEIDGDIKCQIIVENSKGIFFEIIENIFTTKQPKEQIGQNTYIDSNIIIPKSSIIGCNCVLKGNICIGENVEIADNVTILNSVNIGNDVKIQSNTVIGEDGFSYSEDENHNKTMIKHYGSVEIEDNVNIGSNCSIARGTIDATVIRKGSKIDNLCHIAHNVEIGENTTLIAGSIIYGSVKLGKNNYVASGIVRNQCELGDNVTVGMGSVVVENIDANKTVKGIPAK